MVMTDMFVSEFRETERPGATAGPWIDRCWSEDLFRGLEMPAVIVISVGGSLLAIRSGGATPLGYESVLLEAVAACLIGGIALQGGRGDFYGLFAGLLTLRLVISGISNFGAPFWVQNLAAGLLLILVIAAETLSRAIWNRRALGLASRGSS